MYIYTVYGIVDEKHSFFFFYLANIIIADDNTLYFLHNWILFYKKMNCS